MTHPAFDGYCAFLRGCMCRRFAAVVQSAEAAEPNKAPEARRAVPPLPVHHDDDPREFVL